MADGFKSGGRQKGVRNKNTEARMRALGKGELPLDYMIRVMRALDTPDDRKDDLAKAAAPYVHAKLATIAHTGEDGGPLKVEVVKFSNS